MRGITDMLPFLLVGAGMWWLGGWTGLALWAFCLAVMIASSSDRAKRKR